jgi:predicted nucleic acid-binding protein
MRPAHHPPRHVPAGAEVDRLRRDLAAHEEVHITGLVLQELLQGFRGPKAREALVARLRPLPLLVPDRRDHIEAAEIRTTCRRAGVQLGTVDALLAQLCLRHRLMMLTTDRDFVHVSKVVPLEVWGAEYSVRSGSDLAQRVEGRDASGWPEASLGHRGAQKSRQSDRGARRLGPLTA